MRTKLLALATATLAVAACTSDEKIEINQSAPQEIAFNAPLINPVTKATDNADITANTFSATRGFTASAVHTEGKFTGTNNGWLQSNSKAWFTDVDFTKVASEITIESTTYATWMAQTEKQYWPKKGYLAIQAIAPVASEISKTSLSTTNAATGVSVTGFVNTQSDGKYPTDLLYSARIVDQEKATEDKQWTSDPAPETDIHYGIDLQFKHALSAVVFTAATKEDYGTGWTFELTSVKLTNLGDVTDFSANLTETTTDFAATPNWTAPSTQTASYQALKGSAIETPSALTVGYGEDALKKPISDANYDFRPLLIIPQAFNATVGSESKLEITYKITKNNPTSIVMDDCKAIFKLADLFAKADASPSENSEYDDGGAKMSAFEAGKMYRFNIILGLDEIHVAPQILDWTYVIVENIENTSYNNPEP